MTDVHVQECFYFGEHNGDTYFTVENGDLYKWKGKDVAGALEVWKAGGRVLIASSVPGVDGHEKMSTTWIVKELLKRGAR